MINLNKINKIYDGLAGKVHALKDVTLQIEHGESTVIIGKSGSGKSTLLNILSGIDRPQSGELTINGENLLALNENQLAKWRGKNVGIVFQFYQLLPTLSAMDNIVFAMDMVNSIPKKDRKQRALSLLAEVELAEKAHKFPNELSGGEVQRVAIARALANDPPIIIADEPTGNLDSKTGEQIYSLFQRLKEKGKNLIIVTHEDISKRKFDHVITIQDGILNNFKATV
ncbi:ABC transporter ATP-binding protein [Runella sp.]|uniref:ABC transporter ATP-binding protein n=1 Tax=Runella sp. TaxID=1960881 RepID=UPI003D0FFE51